MRGFLIRWLIHGVSLWAASLLVPGLSFPGNPPSVMQVATVAAIFGLVHAVVRPILALATCGLYVLTLGLFHFVLNALLLGLTAWLAGGWLNVDSFWSAFLAALVVSIIGTVLTAIFDPPGSDGEGGPIVLMSR